jgi:hypothetical protein
MKASSGEDEFDTVTDIANARPRENEKVPLPIGCINGTESQFTTVSTIKNGSRMADSLFLKLFLECRMQH